MEYLKEYKGKITKKIISGLEQLGELYDSFDKASGTKADYYYYIKNKNNFKIIYSIIVDKNNDEILIGKIMTEPIDAKINENGTSLIREFIENIEKIEELRGKFTNNDLKNHFM